MTENIDGNIPAITTGPIGMSASTPIVAKPKWNTATPRRANVDKRYGRNVGFECFFCKAYAGVPDPSEVIGDICEQCQEEIETEEEA